MTSQPPNPILSKTLGALLGVHCGDSLGATLEFMRWDAINADYPNGLRNIIGGGGFRWPPGHATDDTDLTRAVLLAYRDRAFPQPGTRPSDFDIVKSAADYSMKWLRGDWPGRELGYGPRDIGGATEQGLNKYRITKDPRNAGAGHDQAGNGSLMRCIPTGLFTSKAGDRIAESMEISAVTHDDKRCTVACAAYNEMVAALVSGKSAEEAVEIGEQVAVDLHCPAVEAAIKKGEKMSILEIAKFGPAEDMSGGYVLLALRLAVAAVLDERGAEDVLVDVVRIGGDTDTNGAIAGGLLGARDGVEAWPERWLQVLQFRGEFEEISTRLLEARGSL